MNFKKKLTKIDKIMSRSLKFRIWDKEEQKYFKPIYEAYKGKLLDLSITLSGEVMRRTIEFPAEHESTFPNRYEIEQFTGKTDKNGTDLYEGDITIDEDGRIRPVEWLDDDYCFYFGISGYVLDQEVGCDTSELEIIGNIHQNKLLLK